MISGEDDLDSGSKTIWNSEVAAHDKAKRGFDFLYIMLNIDIHSDQYGKGCRYWAYFAAASLLAAVIHHPQTNQIPF